MKKEKGEREIKSILFKMNQENSRTAELIQKNIKNKNKKDEKFFS